MAELAVAACANHPGREALGVCVRCRTQVCSECSTKVEGINHCVRCLHELAAAGGRATPRRASARGRGVLGAILYLGLLSLLVWVQLELMLPGVS